MQIHLITGSSRGIGFELSKQYLERGDIVYATCRNPEAAMNLANLQTEFGDQLRIAELDVDQTKQAEALANLLKENHTKLDTLIFNAGVLLPEGFGNWSEDAFLATLKTNLIGPALLAQTFAPLLKEGSKIVFVSSRIGSFASRINLSGDQDSYAISKSALNMLAARLAAKPEMEDKLVVAISPGWVRTDMGGPQATLDVAESAEGIIKTIESLNSSQSGSFLSIEGEAIPW